MCEDEGENFRFSESTFWYKYFPIFVQNKDGDLFFEINFIKVTILAIFLIDSKLTIF